MEIKQIVFLLIIFSLGIFLLKGAMTLTERFTSKKIELRSVLNGFKQKIWMTLGLGIVFFGFYFLSIYAWSFFIHTTTHPDLFILLYHYPIYFIYLGLLIFASLSTAIYLIRLIIISIYHRKTRD